MEDGVVDVIVRPVMLAQSNILFQYAQQFFNC